MPSYTTTTTSRRRSRRREGRAPRPASSPVTARLLLALLERPRTSRELARETGLASNEVTAYLSYYKRRGLVTRVDRVWALTEEGRRYVSAQKEWLMYLIAYEEDNRSG